MVATREIGERVRVLIAKGNGFRGWLNVLHSQSLFVAPWGRDHARPETFDPKASRRLRYT